MRFIHGRNAVLTIFHDDKIYDEITLSDLQTRQEMHQLMKDKGFVRKSEQDIQDMKDRYAREDEEARIHQEQLKEARKLNHDPEAEARIAARRKEVQKKLKEARDKAKAEAAEKKEEPENEEL